MSDHSIIYHTKKDAARDRGKNPGGEGRNWGIAAHAVLYVRRERLTSFLVPSARSAKIFEVYKKYR